MMSSKPVALGFGCGSGTGFVADLKPKAGFGFRIKRRFAVSLF
jgi:hypothetical protein